MSRIIDLEPEELAIIIQNTATKKGVSSAIIEKDLWVYIILEYLFGRSPWKNHLAFKGGTSLSKAYGLIERFSEDIDIILDWRMLGYSKNEPLADRSINQQNKYNQEILDKTTSFLRETFIPRVQNDLKKSLKSAPQVSLDEDGTVLVSYRNSYIDESILRFIRLEIGALAAWTPTQTVNIRPYIAEEYPRLFSEDNINVRTTTAERTFWEKITILHREAFRTPDKPVPQRISRHYYDVYQMAHRGIANMAKAKPALLEQVSAFKAKFYPQSWAHYELARIGALRLVPPEASIATLEDDYRAMKNMVYGEYPDFEVLIDYVRDLEFMLNS